MTATPTTELRERGLQYLRQSLGRADAEFHDGQWEAIEALLRKKRILVVQRTGWGKSVVYFLATRLLRDQGAGPTIMISPLLALMRNQVEAADRLSIRAATINYTNTQEWPEIKNGLLEGAIDLLIVSPEQLGKDIFRDEVLIPLAGRVGLFGVDEAHCISDWGHDFRPDYRRIANILKTIPSNVPVIATTATANDRVVADVTQQMGKVDLIRGPLVRSSLRLQNIELPSQSARSAWLAQHLPAIDGSGIIYTLTVKDADRVASWLQSQGINAYPYHGKSADRPALEQALLRNEIKALVATVALGMGFDKPDLRFVIHFQRPGSVVHYYQQVGRAGRAVDEAYGILLSGTEDDDIVDWFITSSFPPAVYVERVLDCLDQHDSLTIPQLEQYVNLSQGKLEQTLKYLAFETPPPVVKQGSQWSRTPAKYVHDQRRIDALSALRRDEQRQMQQYMASRECLMRFLAAALDDPHARDCGRCANCVGTPLLHTSFDLNLANAATRFLRRLHDVFKPRLQWPAGGLKAYGFRGKIKEDLQVEPGKGLAVWGDAGWSELVRKGKYESARFGDELVGAMAQMINEWNPDSKPKWLTCVPSRRAPELVPDFARRLAERLKLPFVDCVRKVSDTEPQKTMQNSVQQVRNLDGAFSVDARTMPSGPAFLLDDMVDSQWTITVIGALLRKAGCPAVIPVVLANTRRGGS